MLSLLSWLCVCVWLSVCLNLQEKGTTPLHVAAKAGQILQAELLVVYGADPGAPDINGRTPMDYARYTTVEIHFTCHCKKLKCNKTAFHKILSIYVCVCVWFFLGKQVI